MNVFYPTFLNVFFIFITFLRFLNFFSERFLHLCTVVLLFLVFKNKNQTAEKVISAPQIILLTYLLKATLHSKLTLCF